MKMRISIVITICILLHVGHPVHAQEELVKRDQSSESYMDLIRRNFQLRKELKDLEKNYSGLANERKVLILHVRELQETRNERLNVIQDLKNMIASLRIEMLKDPKLTKTIDLLNQRRKQAEEGRDQLQVRAVQMESEKKNLENEIATLEKLLGEEKKADDQQREKEEAVKAQAAEKNLQLQGELDKLRGDLKSQEEGLKVVLAKSKNEKTNLTKLNKDLEMNLEKVQDLLEKAEWDLKKEKQNREGDQRLTKELNRLRNDFNKQEKELKASLQKLKDKDSTLKEVKTDLQVSQASLKRTEAELKKESQGRKKDRQLTAQIEVLRTEFNEKEDHFNVALKRVVNEKSNVEKVNKDLEKNLRITETLLKTADTDLQKEKKYSIENRRLVKELKETQRLIESIEKNLKGKMTTLKKEKENVKRESKSIIVENKTLKKKIAQFEEITQIYERESQQLLADLKKEKLDFDRINKDLKKERLKNTFEQEHLAQEIKNTRADRAMFEAKVGEIQNRAAFTENELQSVKDELESVAAKNLLRESEVTVLQQEKSNLEEKLVKYIGKLIDQQDEVQSPRVKTWGRQKTFASSKTKEEIVRQKLDMHYNLALAYDKREMYKEEEKEYRKCLKINPNDANVHYNLAILYDDKLHMNKKAVEHYKKFLELNPSGEGSNEVKRWILHAQQDQRFTEIK